MHWLALSGAIVCEIIGTLSLRSTNEFRRLAPSLLVVCAYAVSFYLLSIALRGIEVGVAYAIWSAVGTAFIATIGIVFRGETASVLKLVSIALVVVGVVGLNLASHRA